MKGAEFLPSFSFVFVDALKSTQCAWWHLQIPSLLQQQLHLLKDCRILCTKGDHKAPSMINRYYGYHEVPKCNRVFFSPNCGFPRPRLICNTFTSFMDGGLNILILITSWSLFQTNRRKKISLLLWIKNTIKVGVYFSQSRGKSGLKSGKRQSWKKIATRVAFYGNHGDTCFLRRHLLQSHRHNLLDLRFFSR